METGFGTTVAGGTLVSSVSIGNDTVTGNGVGVCAEATPLINKQAPTANAMLIEVFRPARARECDRFVAMIEDNKDDDDVCIIRGLRRCLVNSSRVAILFVAPRIIGCICVIFFKKKTKHPNHGAFSIRYAGI